MSPLLGPLSDYNITLHEMTISRSFRAKWLAIELGILDEIALQPVPLHTGVQYAAPFKALNPMSAVPLLQLTHRTTAEETVLTESAAICRFLVDHVPSGAHFKPPLSNLPAHAAYHRWIAFAAASMDQWLWQVRLHEELLPEQRRLPPAARIARNTFLEKCVPALETALSDGRRFLCEPAWQGFSVADIMVGYACMWASRYGLLDHSDVLKAYMKRVMERDAFKEAFGDGTL